MATETQTGKGNRYRLARPEEADGLVIHCSDPRFQAAFRQFIEQELGLKNPIPIIIPGGIHDLVSPARIKAARQLREQLEFMVKEGGVRRVVLLNHEDCQWYGKWNALVQTAIGEDIAGHLLLAAEKLAEKKFGVEVECYLAEIEDGDVVFSRVGR
jgi:hypothetical protein